MEGVFKVFGGGSMTSLDLGGVGSEVGVRTVTGGVGSGGGNNV